MKILSVASECTPLVKTGGLADVVGALPAALAGEGAAMRVLLPAYRGLAGRLEGAETVTAGDLRLIAGQVGGTEVLLLVAPELYERAGGPYVDTDGRDWPDNHLRFARLAQAASAIGRGALPGWQPDAIHAHDWQAGLVPAYLAAAGGGPPVLLTIHNIAFQGLYPPSVLAEIDLPGALYHAEALEFWGQLGYLKGGIALATRLSTVSPSYARELARPEFGMGLEGLIARRAGALSGILNGIDLAAWDPETDPAIAAPYSARRPQAKARNRRALAERFGLAPAPDAPLCIVVSRMTWQKGLDLLLGTLPAVLSGGVCLAILGSGEPGLETGFAEAARSHPGRIGCVIGYDEALSHLMQAGADAILVPSRFEPCGLTQLYALRYGTIPVVARTGGLSDTVIDANDAAVKAGVATGLLHEPDSAAALTEAVGRATALFRAPAWARMRRNAMRHPVGWGPSAAAYAALYREMAA